MKYLSRDIIITLLIKFSLLIALWFLCFKGVEKPIFDAKSWLLGNNSLSSSSTQTQSR